PPQPRRLLKKKNIREPLRSEDSEIPLPPAPPGHAGRWTVDDRDAWPARCAAARNESHAAAEHASRAYVVGLLSPPAGACAIFPAISTAFWAMRRASSVVLRSASATSWACPPSSSPSGSAGAA